MPNPKRYVVSATLLTCSPLAIHSGLGSEDQVVNHPESDTPPFRVKSDWNFKELESCDQLIVRDANNLPYIPGSSLKGVFSVSS
ncbi:MAG: hypothetical protein JW829_08370 [Pirellulales bacterium]|nr:hypothetical protein [Pirellulales bacterium]